MTKIHSMATRLQVFLVLLFAGLIVLLGLYMPKKQSETLLDFHRQELTASGQAIAHCSSMASDQGGRADAIACLSAYDWPNSIECSGIQFEGDATLFTHPENTDPQSLDEENPLVIAIPLNKGDIRGTIFIKGSASYFQSSVSKSLLPFQLVLGIGALFMCALLLTILKVSRPLKALQERANDSGSTDELSRETEELKETLNEITNSRNRFWAVIQSAPGPVILTDTASKILEWSVKAEQVLGWTREEVLGMKLSELIVPHDLSQDALLEMEHYDRTGDSHLLNRPFEVSALQKNGNTIDASVYLAEMTIDGQTMIASYIRDISYSKKLSHDLNQERDLSASLLNGLPLMVCLKNEALQFTFINDRACKVLGKSKEVLLGRKEKEVFDEDWVEESIALDRAGYDGMDVPLIERVFTVAGKEEKYVIGRYPFSVGEKNPIRYLLTYGFNITKLKKVQAELEDALKAKDAFLATVSHEIRTPLHSIIVLASLLNREDRKDETEHFAQNIHRSSQHLLELVNDILDFSKVEAGQLELDPTPLQLDSFLETLTRIDSGERNENVTFHKTSSGCEGVYIQCDSTRLSQVINNLISNAFKFTESGEITLSVLCKVNNNTAIIDWSVKDTGIGISPENTSLIKEAFQQAHTGISRQFGGTGLGLGIVVHILNLMESDLEIESELGKGSEFKFTLSVPVLNAVSKAPVQKPKKSSLRTDGLRMLYVEDTVPNQMVMQAMCKPWNLNLTIASSGAAAIEILQSQSFDLILMDIQMPGMDGIETLRKIHLLEIDLPQIYAFTAHGGSDSNKKYKKLGFSGVLEKPITPIQLEEFIKSYSNDNQNPD